MIESTKVGFKISHFVIPFALTRFTSPLVEKQANSITDPSSYLESFPHLHPMFRGKLTMGLTFKTLSRIYTKSVRTPKSYKWPTPRKIQTYKTLQTNTSKQFSLWKSQLNLNVCIQGSTSCSAIYMPTFNHK
ncbi:hypothetical protein AMECASPLE_003091 [Ameca splendens]|uniref:Uncharacterized protein n=1 Tax=Ameca splendens TaxID=208324 RepID=A0ABV0XYS9_9TELE